MDVARCDEMWQDVARLFAPVTTILIHLFCVFVPYKKLELFDFRTYLSGSAYVIGAGVT